MKKLKKLGSVLLALAVMFVMTSTAFATGETTYSLTLSGTVSGHTYEVYQIFTGDISTNSSGKKVLSNIKYGQNYSPNEKNEGDKADSTDINLAITDPTSFADQVNTNLEGRVYSSIEAKGTSIVISEMPAGYYFVRDITDVKDKNDAVTKFILQVVGDTEAAIKASVPSVIKKIVENGEFDYADYSVGDLVKFRLTGTLPTTLDTYSAYKYVFHDTLSSGLTYNTETSNLKVYLVNNTDGSDETDITNKFSTVYNAESGKLTISCSNIKDIEGVNAGSKIVVEYFAELNSNAVVGSAGNANEVYLQFSNNPNQSGSGETDSTGNTPVDKVIVFTYELDVTKVDGQNTDTKLSGAQFKLKNSEGKWAVVNSDGKITKWESEEAKGTVLISDSNGLFKVAGLDEGTYYLKETKAPTGYNLLENDILIVIDSNISQTEGLKELTITVGDTTTNGDTTSGIVSTTVKNNAGTVLPSTGGIGTTLFYVIGGVLVLAAIVLLVTRRRMREE